MTRLTLVLATLLTTSGCASQIMSPPARFQSFEGPLLSAEGETRVHVDGGVGGQVFGPSAAGGTVRVSHRTDTLEWSGELSGAYLIDNLPSTASRSWGALRGGARGLLVDGFEHAYWGAGFGLGAYAGGLYVSPDLGLGIGYKNHYITPYLGVSALASLPFVARTVDTTDDLDDPQTDRPLVTVGLRIEVGAQIPITSKAALTLGAHAVQLVDIEGTSEGWMGFGGGFQFAL